MAQAPDAPVETFIAAGTATPSELRSRWFDDSLRRQAISNGWRIWRTRPLRSACSLQSPVVSSTAMLALPKAVAGPATAPK
jgi:hypothetical protein